MPRYSPVVSTISTKLRLRRISIWPVVKLSFIIYFVLGFVLGLFYAFIIFVMLSLPAQFLDPSDTAPFLFAGGIVLVFLPFGIAIFSAVGNTIFTFLIVIIYNFFARYFGGVEYEVETVETPQPRQKESAIVAAPPVPPYSPQTPTHPPSTDYSI